MTRTPATSPAPSGGDQPTETRDLWYEVRPAQHPRFTMETVKTCHTVPAAVSLARCLDEELPAYAPWRIFTVIRTVRAEEMRGIK